MCPINTVNPQDLYIGRAEVYIDVLDANRARTGERFLGDCPGFGFSIADELRDKYSSAEATAPLIKSVNVRRTPEATITLDEWNKENLALAFMGSAGFFAQTGASKANYVPPTARVKQGYWFPLEDPTGTVRRGTVAEPLTAVVVTGPSATPVYALGTDYLVDLVSGRIYVIVGGAIADGAALEVDFTFPTLSGSDAPYLQIGTLNTIEAYIRLKSKQATGPSMEMEIWIASLTPDGDVTFIGDDYGEFNIRARVLADTVNHSTEPYGRVYELAAS